MTICQNIFHQIFEELVSVKISPVKILHYTVLGSGLLSSITIISYQCMQLAIFYLAHKEIVFLMSPLIMTYEGLVGMKGLIHYIRLDMHNYISS